MTNLPERKQPADEIIVLSSASSTPDLLADEAVGSGYRITADRLVLTERALAGDTVIGGYANHCDMAIDGGGNIFILATVDGPGTNDLDAVVVRCDVATGQWIEVTRFSQVREGKQGYGSIEIDGVDLVCALSVRNTDNQQVIVVRRLPGIAVPLIDLRAVIAAGQPGAKTPLAQTIWNVAVRAARAVFNEYLRPLAH